MTGIVQNINDRLATLHGSLSVDELNTDSINQKNSGGHGFTATVMEMGRSLSQKVTRTLSKRKSTASAKSNSDHQLGSQRGQNAWGEETLRDSSEEGTDQRRCFSLRCFGCGAK